MLRNRRGATSLRWLRALLDHGIEVRGQIVVCPGVNDGTRLDDTLAGVLDEYPELAHVAVVPLGLSRFNPESNLRVQHDRRGARRHRCGRGLAGRLPGGSRTSSRACRRRVLPHGRAGVPDVDRYEGFPMHEDGVGMARTFEREFHGHVDDVTGHETRLLRCCRHAA